MGKTLEPDVIRDQAAFLRLALPTKYHDFFDALCRTALRPDSGGEAVREACARVAERAAFYWNKPGDISTETERMICKARETEAMAIRNEIRGLVIPLPTLPAAEGWEADARRWKEYAGHLEVCSTCAEEGTNCCPVGRELMDAAHGRI